MTCAVELDHGVAGLVPLLRKNRLVGLEVIRVFGAHQGEVNLRQSLIDRADFSRMFRDFRAEHGKNPADFITFRELQLLIAVVGIHHRERLHEKGQTR